MLAKHNIVRGRRGKAVVVIVASEVTIVVLRHDRVFPDDYEHVPFRPPTGRLGRCATKLLLVRERLVEVVE
jgi:hypothetical protein